MCSRCGRPITGQLELLTAISDANNTSAHFYCYYPRGVDDHSLDMNARILDRIARLSPERARYFRPVRPLL